MAVDNLYDSILRAADELVTTRRHVLRKMQSARFVMSHLRELRELQRLTSAPYFLRSGPQQKLLEEALADCDDRVLAVRATLQPAPLMVIAEDLCRRFAPEAGDLAQVKALHRTRVRITSASAPRPILAGVVGLGAVAGSLIPQEVFDYLELGWYGLFRTIIAVCTIAILFYAALSLAPAYLAYRKRSLIDVMASELVEHMDALCSGKIGGG